MWEVQKQGKWEALKNISRKTRLDWYADRRNLPEELN